MTTLSTIAKTVRQAGHIWHIDFWESYTQIRAEIGRHQIRIVIAKPGQSLTPNVLPEKSSSLHIVRDLSSLRAWLKTFSS